jgi:Protein of unknown function (DUF3467)
MSRSPKPRTLASKGLYANYFEVGHTPFEIVIDFGQRYAQNDPSPCHTRIVTSPLYAESLRRTLEDALARYRERFGDVE